jgi:hypothetical protein
LYPYYYQIYVGITKCKLIDKTIDIEIVDKGTPEKFRDINDELVLIFPIGHPFPIKNEIKKRRFNLFRFFYLKV